MISEVTAAAYSPEELRALSERLRGKPAEEVVHWAADTFGQEIALAGSFGAEDVVVIDMIAKVVPGIRVFTLDTGRLHDETYEVLESVAVNYCFVIQSYFLDREIVEQLERV